MKVKLAILGLVVVCLWGRPAYADTIVDISATWCSACQRGGFPPVDFQAQATVEPVTGTFFNILFNDLFTGSVMEVTGISGTLNGSPISFLQAPQGAGSWLYPDLFIGALYFTANGQPGWMFWDGAFPYIVITDDTGTGFPSPVDYSASVHTPEPGTLGLVGLGLAFLCCRLKARAVAPHASRRF
jgi:PEP-CTERM putative exosortase interaction domain